MSVKADAKIGDKGKNYTMLDLHFATSAYGDPFVGLLLTNIYSIHLSHPSALITVYWQDINPIRIQQMQQAFPTTKFVQTNYNLSNDYKERIASKMLLCEQAVNESPKTDLCFLDCDMIVLRSLDKYFASEFDIAFTVKPEKFPINAGIVLVRCSEKTRIFFREWRIKALEVVADGYLSAQASSKDYPYGGPGQMALQLLINFSVEQKVYTPIFDQEIVRLISYPCSELNETNSVAITSKKHVLHYKGGWQPILVKGKDFSKYRTKNDSFEMYIFYLQTFKQAIELLRHYDSSIAYEDFFIKIPFYLNDDFKEIPLMYCAFSLQQSVRNLFERGGRVFQAIRNRF